MKWGLTIRKARTEAGLTQVQLAAKARVSLATVQNIEADRANPEVGTLQSILSPLGLRLEVQSRSWEPKVLIPLGLPLLDAVVQSRLRQQANKYELMDHLISLTPNLGRLRPGSREQAAVVGFLWALRDHYPAIWSHVPPKVKSWLNRQLKADSPPIKLRRISLSHLAEYL